MHFIGGDCFLENLDYQGANINQGCAKKDTIQECQLLCQKTSRCVRFSYITNQYNGKHGNIARKNCCLKDNEVKETKIVQDVMSGPAYCKERESSPLICTVKAFMCLLRHFTLCLLHCKQYSYRIFYFYAIIYVKLCLR